MQQGTIVQFVCFETSVELDEFAPRWEHYAKRFACKDVEVMLQQQAGIKNKFKYISQQKCPEDNFQFAFMKGRDSDSFPDCAVKVLQAGGYTPMQIECIHDTDTHDVKVMLFIIRAESDISRYRQLPSYRYLNIYRAYYESCIYEYILEFFLEEIHARDFVKQLKSLPEEAEIGMYKECLVLSE